MRPSPCPQGTCVFCIVCGTCACDAWSYSGNVCVWLCHHSCSPYRHQRYSRLVISLNSAAQHGLHPKTAVGWPRSRGYGSRRPGESVLFGTIRCAGEVGRCPAWVQPWAVMARAPAWERARLPGQEPQWCRWWWRGGDRTPVAGRLRLGPPLVTPSGAALAGGAQNPWPQGLQEGWASSLNEAGRGRTQYAHTATTGGVSQNPEGGWGAGPPLPCK